MSRVRSEPCRNCEVEIYLDLVSDPASADKDWEWTHVAGDGACAAPEPMRGTVFRAEPGEL